MEKTLKALEVCASGAGCAGCPYKGMEDCDKKMLQNAISLLKATESNSKYTMAYTYTKKGNLIPYVTGKVMASYNARPSEAERIREYYKAEREIQLISLFRWEDDKCFCKIKCPVNPLPVKGEFQIPSVGVLSRFLRENGWIFSHKTCAQMFE